MVFSTKTASGTNKPQTPMELPEGFETDDRETESALEMPPIEENKELKEGELTLFDHTNFIWMGDLNYRIDLKRDDIVKAIKEENWKLLRSGDQLVQQIAQDKVFQGFVEGDLAFRPTYKFDAGTDTYDSSRKMRLPAFCDRVLWRAQSQIKCLSYRSHMELMVSDHKPVSAVLQIKLAPYATSPPRKTNSSDSLGEGSPTTSSSKSSSSSSLSTPPSPGKEANGMAKSAFPKKSYFFTTTFRFFKALLKSPATYIVVAVAIGAASYLAAKQAGAV